MNWSQRQTSGTPQLISPMHCSQSPWQWSAGHSLFSPGGAASAPQRWKQSPTTGHGLIQTALEQGEASEHLQYVDDIMVWGNTAEEVFEKGKKIV